MLGNSVELFTLDPAATGVSFIMATGNSGTVSKMGAMMAWIYDPETERLSLTCTRSVFASPASIVAKLAAMVDGFSCAVRSDHNFWRAAAVHRGELLACGLHNRFLSAAI